MKFAYCGYDFFHDCLEELLRAGHELVELFTIPTDNEWDFNTRVINSALKVGAKVTLSPITVEDLARLEAQGCECLVAAAYAHKVPVGSIKTLRTFNIHPSKLPLGRGPWPMPWTILKNLPESAVTFHEMSAQYDTGRILKQLVFPVLPQETLESLSLRVQKIARENILEVMTQFDQLKRAGEEQGPGEYWKIPFDADRTIDWRMPVSQIDRIVRAFGKFESYAVIDGVSYSLHNVVTWQEPHRYEPGTVVTYGSRMWLIAAADGYVAISHWRKE